MGWAVVLRRMGRPRGTGVHDPASGSGAVRGEPGGTRWAPVPRPAGESLRSRPEAGSGASRTLEVPDGKSRTCLGTGCGAHAAWRTLIDGSDRSPFIGALGIQLMLAADGCVNLETFMRSDRNQLSGVKRPRRECSALPQEALMEDSGLLYEVILRHIYSLRARRQPGDDPWANSSFSWFPVSWAALTCRR